MKKSLVCLSFVLASLFGSRSLSAQWTLVKPDLRITDVIVVNDWYTYVFVVNYGFATAGANHLSLQVDGVICNYVSVPAIAPGSWNGRWIAVYNPFSYTNNLNTFHVDRLNQVAETNEANNTLRLDRRLR